MAQYRANPGQIVSDYAQLRTVPAILAIVFAVCSAFQFGGLAQPELIWASYTLVPMHATVISMLAFLLAFMSSKTRDFEDYRLWEQALIALGPVLILGHQFLPFVADFIAQDMWYGVGAFAGTFASWGAAVR